MSGLTGMKSICGYLNRSETTVLDLIRADGFPATKIGGVWESDTDLIDTWRREKIKEVEEGVVVIQTKVKASVKRSPPGKNI